MSIRHGIAIVAAGAALLTAGACSDATDTPLPPEVTTTDAGPTSGSNSPPTTTEPDVPVEMQNAIDSARSYVEMSGFSEAGLIEQLSSEYGEGYPTDVATEAVESLDVDWRAEAVESAESYMDMSSFSRSGLIEQLTSEYGDGFTRSQAEYAVSEVF